MDVHGNHFLIDYLLNFFDKRVLDPVRDLQLDLDLELDRDRDQEYPATTIWVAYSGGLDSHVLLDLMKKINLKTKHFSLKALHINHGLNKKANDWSQHCEEVAARLEIPIQIVKVNAARESHSKESPEEAARRARWQAFQSVIKQNEYLLLAHHALDQAETILLRLFRGTGPLGLSGMPEKGRVGQGEFLRPLLSINKEDLECYAKEFNLNYIEDDSNSELRFDRNFLRQEIFPKLSKRWPKVTEAINRSGFLCSETNQILQALAALDYEKVRSETRDQLSIKKLLQLSAVSRKHALRFWLQSLNLNLPSHAHMERIDKEIIQAKPGSKPRLKIDHYEIRREKGNLLVNEYSKLTSTI